ncbi:MAG TPA: CaiB/BaiF CoA-transferase family protein, partial [Candidatus Baltobacteraceae bacterium]|nr:CaiB/BaiF CoA-transferase family protein [Candidatus Baltobacteraceae bacterium]
SVVHGLSSYYVLNVRNKESIALDLRDPEALAAVVALARRADVIVENFAPGVVARLGLGYATIARDNPRVVYAHISGYGQQGPYRNEKAFDLLVQGESGMLTLTGTPEEICKVPISVVDIASAMYATQAVLLALMHRAKTGEGQEIDVSMLHSIVAWLGAIPYFYWFRDETPPRTGANHYLISPYGPYLCSDGTYVNFAAASNAAWKAFSTKVIERPDLAEDPRFAANEGRVANRAELEREVAGAIATRTQDEWIAAMHEHDIPCGRVRNLGEVLRHPQLEATGAFIELPSPVGAIPFVRSPIELPRAPSRRGPVPLRGQQTRSILAELGYNEGAIAGLLARGAAGEPG